MGKRGNIITCVASFGVFALGAAVGSHRARRRQRRQQLQPSAALCVPSSPAASCSSTSPEDETPPPPIVAPLDCPVCLGDLVLPRVTPCGHTLCSTCLAALFGHERRPACPICRKRIRASVEKLPVNFLVKAVVEARVAERGEGAWRAYREVEEEAKRVVRPFAPRDERQRQSVVAQLRPAWNWFKWTVIIVTEFGAFLVSLKEVLESTPARRRYQRIV